MKIAIDAIPFMTPKTGVGYYTYNLISEFLKIAPQNSYYLCDVLIGRIFYNMYRLEDVSSLNYFSNYFANISKMPFPFNGLIWALLSQHAKATGKTAKIKLEDADIFFGTNFRGIFKETLKTVITIHDMAHEYYPEATSKRIFNYLKKLQRSAEKADLIIADSENTKKDVEKILNIPNEKIKVIYLGVDPIFRPINDKDVLDPIRRKYNIYEKFILYVGAIQPRKNIATLIRAYSMLCKEQNFEHKLVIAGGVGWKNKNIRPLIEELKLKDKIIFTGYISEHDLPAIYNLSDAFVFPSLYEGFGLPVLEAMACGVTVVTSNVSSLPEVAGDAALLINPHSIEDLADGIRRILHDEGLRKKNIAKGLEQAKLFTWEKCARETLDVFSQALSQK
ncbi:MAG: glycosyltransferase family 4 protein [Proteobacteria bacterium]|nr:glycosyltransferase family 4 protein [Pseudomonadota bacterium]